MTRALSAEARDLSISALGILISALSRSVSALSDLGLKRGRKRIMDQGSRIMDHGSRIMGHGSKIMDQRSWIKDLGPCSAMNDHPGRDTDVISRLPKSTIKDRSFYIGFTRIGSSYKDRIKDLEPWTLFWHELPF